MISEIEKQKAKEKNIIIDYSDDDIIIVDNIKSLKGQHTKRIPINIILLCTKGMMQADVKGNRIVLHKHEILIISPNTFLENTMSSDDFECKAMGLTNKIIHSFLRPHVNIWNKMMYLNKSRVRKIEAHDAMISLKFYELIDMLKQMENKKYKNLIMQSLVKAGILGICGSLDKAIDEEESNNQQGDVIFRRFLDILGNSSVKRQKVEYYAERLFITPKYLSVVCKTCSGKTALQWIQEYVNDEVGYYLKQTDLSIKEISDKLGFPNASFFGRYVKQHFGASPKSIRAKKIN